MNKHEIMTEYVRDEVEAARHPVLKYNFEA